MLVPTTPGPGREVFATKWLVDSPEAEITGSARCAAQIGYRSVYWTIDTLNWQTTATPDSITKTVMAHIGNGVIILMYAGSQVESDTLDELMTKIEQMKYQMVTVTQVAG